MHPTAIAVNGSRTHLPLPAGPSHAMAGRARAVSCARPIFQPRPQVVGTPEHGPPGFGRGLHLHHLLTMTTKQIADLLHQLEQYDYEVELFKSLESSACIIVRKGKVDRSFNRPVDALTWLDAKLDTLRETRREGDSDV